MNVIKLPPTLPDLDKLIDIAIETGGETDRFDFKEIIDLRNDVHKVRLIRAIGAFANTDEGGFILIGISNDQKITGLQDDVYNLFDQTPVHNIVNKYLSPPPFIQVRKHEREGKNLVIIEVQPFKEFPSIVRESATFGSDKLVAGSILFRNAAAESAVLTAESDIRKLCDIIVKRRASTFIELFQRGTLGRIYQKSDKFEELQVIRKRADNEWPSSEGAKPYIEVAFSSEDSLNLTPEQLKSLIPAACIKIRHGFPFVDVSGSEVYRYTSWGWYGMIPFSLLGENDTPPSYLWLLSRKGAFLDREYLWEDSPGSSVQGGVALFHVIGRLILIIRFLLSFSETINVARDTKFRLLIKCNNVISRFLKEEDDFFPPHHLPRAAENVVEAVIDISLNDIRQRQKEIALFLFEEIVWQFGRDDLTRHDLENYLSKAREFLGREYALTD